jgi:hypothetical protein
MPSLIEETTTKARETLAGAVGKGPGNKRLSTDKLKVGAAGVMLFAAAVVLYIQFFTGPPSIAEETRGRSVIDAESREVIVKFPVPDDTRAPWVNPKTGKATLFPAEKCYWTKDGKAKLTPTYVLLNQYIGKDGQTTCPDCGRPVRIHNEMPPAELMEAAASGK